MYTVEIVQFPQKCLNFACGFQLNIKTLVSIFSTSMLFVFELLIIYIGSSVFIFYYNNYNTINTNP